MPRTPSVSSREQSSGQTRVLSIALLLATVFATVAGLVFLFRLRNDVPQGPNLPPPPPGPLQPSPSPEPMPLPPVGGGGSGSVGGSDGSGVAPIGGGTSEPAVPNNAALERACTAAGGKWEECGSACHGAPEGTACILMCVPQCLCGGASAWTCPKGLTCGSKDAKGVGVCGGGSTNPDAPVASPPVSATPVRPTPAGMICDAQNFICVDEAAKNATLGNPFTVKGSAIAFENTIQWQLLGAPEQSATLASGFLTTNAPDVGKPGDFTLRAFLPNLQGPLPKQGTLQFFEYSAKDGSAIHHVSLPVSLPQEQVNTSVFLSDVEAAKTGDCTKTVKVTTKMQKTALVIEGSLRRLLEMHASEIDSDTVQTQLPERVRLISFALKDGVAKAVFSSELDNGIAGSCRVGAIRAQIEATLKQFPSVKSVMIQVEGKTPEETLQP